MLNRVVEVDDDGACRDVPFPTAEGAETVDARYGRSQVTFVWSFIAQCADALRQFTDGSPSWPAAIEQAETTKEETRRSAGRVRPAPDYGTPSVSQRPPRPNTNSTICKDSLIQYNGYLGYGRGGDDDAG